MVGAQRTEGSRKNEMNRMGLSYGMQMKAKIRLTGLLLGTNHGRITTNPNQSVLQCNGNISVHFKVTPSAGKVMLTVFRDSRGVLLVHFKKRGENVNSASYCEVLLKIRDAIRRKRPGKLARGVLLYHENVKIQYSPSNPEQNTRTTSYTGNFLN
jgi:hypothetical protein